MSFQSEADDIKNTTPCIATLLSEPPYSENLLMASSEKEIIPLSDLPPKHDSESIADKPSTSGTTNLVPAKYPSRPRRKVAVAVVVIAVVVFIIIAATLIGKYLPEYLRDAGNKCKYLDKLF